MPRFSLLFSLAAHAIVMTFAVSWSILAPGTLPSLRSALAFDDVQLIKIADIPLPAPPRAREQAQSLVATGAAPIVAPEHVLPETGLESQTRSDSDVVSIEHGTSGDLGGIVGGERALPPPPPSAPPAPPQPVRLHSGIRTPRKVVDVPPVYPPLARLSRVEGVVILEAVIDARGSVESVRVLRSIPSLDQAAVDAVRQWTFTPTLLNGEPVPIVMTVTVTFTLR